MNQEYDPTTEKITIAEFRARLDICDDDDEVVFALDGVPIHFMRPKSRGEKFVVLEFNRIERPPQKVVRHNG